MKGSLRERQPGNWELIVQLPRDPETGLRKQLSRTHYGTKREAQRALAALVAKASEGKITSTAKTLGQLAKGDREVERWTLDECPAVGLLEPHRVKVGADKVDLRAESEKR